MANGLLEYGEQKRMFATGMATNPLAFTEKGKGR